MITTQDLETQRRGAVFSSLHIRRHGENPLRSMTVGVCLDDVLIRLTWADYIATEIQDWIKHSIAPRLSMTGILTIKLEMVDR